MRHILGNSWFALAFVIFMTSCSGEVFDNSAGPDLKASALRPLNESEKVKDFDLLADTVRNLYGPLKYKEQRFNFRYEPMVAAYRDKVKSVSTDSEFYGVLKSFLTNLQDGHVGITFTLENTAQYSLPIILTMIEDRAIVAGVTDLSISALHGISVGDEILEIDGVTTGDALALIKRYESFGNDLSDKHMIIRWLQRPSYITEMVPKKPEAQVRFVKPDGTTIDRTFVWKLTRGKESLARRFADTNSLTDAFAKNAAEASLLHMGAATPFFLTPQTEKLFQLVPVKPSEAALGRHGLTDFGKIPVLYAALYRFEGKTILLVRQPTYLVQDNAARIAWYKAILDEYGRFADVLVIDQTHNPGGSMFFAEEFMSLFAGPATRANVNFLRADRRWLNDLFSMIQAPGISQSIKDVWELGYRQVESAYDLGQELTAEPMSVTGSNYILPASFTFRDKPILMLIDELSGSCGDIVPNLMKENGLATLFGERTMGLGGNVSPVVQLPLSLASVNLTRGLFMIYQPDGKYDFNKALENQGVQPQVHYTHTVQDFRAGYVEYFRAFSTAASKLVK
ncbi:MAG: hypothetical protein JNM39_08895 [Bdellovibrionaceae bacterium]|nr:hypothetical protein [Pseudobdellovibrionaceae bacterium]